MRAKTRAALPWLQRPCRGMLEPRELSPVRGFLWPGAAKPWQPLPPSCLSPAKTHLGEWCTGTSAIFSPVFPHHRDSSPETVAGSSSMGCDGWRRRERANGGLSHAGGAAVGQGSLGGFPRGKASGAVPVGGCLTLPHPLPGRGVSGPRAVLSRCVESLSGACSRSGFWLSGAAAAASPPQGFGCCWGWWSLECPPASSPWAAPAWPHPSPHRDLAAGLCFGQKKHLPVAWQPSAAWSSGGSRAGGSSTAGGSPHPQPLLCQGWCRGLWGLLGAGGGHGVRGAAASFPAPGARTWGCRTGSAITRHSRLCPRCGATAHHGLSTGTTGCFRA